MSIRPGALVRTRATGTLWLVTRVYHAPYAAGGYIVKVSRLDADRPGRPMIRMALPVAAVFLVRGHLTTESSDGAVDL